MKLNERLIDLSGWATVAALVCYAIALAITSGCTDKQEAEPITGPVCLECQFNNPGGPPLPTPPYDTCFNDLNSASSYVLKMKHQYVECTIKTAGDE